MAIFEFTETTFVDVIWYAAWTETDWMAVLSKPTADGAWQLVYRFRYYAEGEGADKIWDSDDRKTVYELKADSTEAKRAEIEAAADAIVAKLPGTLKAKLIVRGNSERALELLSVQDWAHQKQMPINEANP